MLKLINITLIPLLILCLLLCSCNAISPHTLAVSLPDGRSVLIPYLMAENKTYYRTGYVDCEEFSRMFSRDFALDTKVPAEDRQAAYYITGAIVCALTDYDFVHPERSEKERKAVMELLTPGMQKKMAGFEEHCEEKKKYGVTIMICPAYEKDIGVKGGLPAYENGFAVPFSIDFNADDGGSGWLAAHEIGPQQRIMSSFKGAVLFTKENGVLLADGWYGLLSPWGTGAAVGEEAV